MAPLKKHDQIHLKRGSISTIEKVFESDSKTHTVSIKTQGSYLPGEVYSCADGVGLECGIEVRSVQPIPNRDSQIVVFVAAAQANLQHTVGVVQARLNR